MKKVIKMMQLNTKYSGTIEMDEKHIIAFEQGIPAFEEETSFVLLPFEKDTPFFVLQSTKTVEVAFILVDPFQYISDYKVNVPDATIEQLEIEKEEDVAIFVILTIREPFTETTANLQAPIIINAKKQKGKQLLMSTSGYKTRHAIFKQLKEAK